MEQIKELIPIEERNGKRAVNARELHDFLESKQEFANWIKNRIEKYGFVENQDFQVFDKFVKNPTGGRPQKEYALSIDMAKELSMIENNGKGRLARKYFIECENRLKEQPKLPTTYLDALKALVKSEEEKQGLLFENKYLADTCDKMVSKAEYYDMLVERNSCTNFRETALQFGMKQTDFIQELADAKFIYRRGHKIRPYNKYVRTGMFVVKDFVNGKYSGKQTLITSDGKDFLRLYIFGTNPNPHRLPNPFECKAKNIPF